MRYTRTLLASQFLAALCYSNSVLAGETQQADDVDGGISDENVDSGLSDENVDSGLSDENVDSGLSDENVGDDPFEIEIEYAAGGTEGDESDLELSDGGIEAGNSETIANFVGLLREKGSRSPIADTTVYLKDTDHEALTDSRGRFKFHDLDPGEYTVIIPTTSYELVESKEHLGSGERIEVKYYLEPIVYGKLEVVVRDTRVKKEVSRTTIKMKEAAVIPGTGGDPVRVIESIPGVARGGGGGSGNALVIRGGNAEDSKVYLDGHWIPMLFHFGGMKSVYNSALLKQFDVYTGGFTAEYGRATGGVVDLRSRRPRTDRIGGYVDLSMIDASAMVEGPIGDNMGFALGVRRSTLDLIMDGANINDKIDGFNFTTYPVYYDYQGKWHYKIDPRNSITIDAYGLFDKVAFAQDAVSDADPTLTGSAEFINQSYNGAVHYRYKTDTFESDFSPAFLHFSQNNKYGPYRLNWTWYAADIREDVRIKLGKNNTVAAGLQLTAWNLQLKSNMVRPPKEGDVNFNFTNSDHVQANVNENDLEVGAYIQDELQLGPVLLMPGIRIDHLASLGDFAIGPRIAMRWTVVDPLVIKASAGLYHRAPDGDEITPPFGERKLEYEMATHVVAGVEWEITDLINVDIQGYFKHLNNLVTSVDDPSSDKIYDNSAEGYVYGGEIMLRHNYTDKFFGWVSYSISRSMRNDGKGSDYRRFDMDQTHNLVAVASWQFAKGWRLGGRFQLTSGEPYTDIKGSVFNADNGTYLPIYDENNKNSKTRPMYHRLDLRLDKEWRFDTWVLHTYLDVQNVYYHKNPVETVDNYDFSEQVHQTDMPILPSLGIMAEF